MSEESVAIDGLSSAVERLAESLYPKDVMAGEDAAGGHVASLTEAVMGITNGLYAIAESIDNRAAAIESHGE